MRSRSGHDGTRCCRRCACGSTYESCGRPTPAAGRPAAPSHAALDRADGRAACRSGSGAPRMKALVTGAAGFIGSTLAEQLLARRRRRRRPRLLHGLLSARDQGAEPRRAHGATRFPLRRVARSRMRISPALLDDRTHVFHLAAQAGVRKSWGTRFRRLYRQQHRGDADAARSAQSGARDSSDSCTRRAPRSTATACRSRCGRMPSRSRCRRTASRSSRPSSSATCTTSNYGVPAVSLRYSRCTDRGSVPTWGSTDSCGRRMQGEPMAVWRRRADTGFHVRARCRGGDDRRGPPRRSRPCIQYWRRVPRLRSTTCSRSSAASSGRTPRHRDRSGAEGRHAAHLRRHDAGADGSRVRSRGRPRRGPRCRIRVVERSIVMRVSLDDVPRVASSSRAGSRPRLRRRRRGRPAGTTDPDQFLFDKGTDGAQRRRSG